MNSTAVAVVHRFTTSLVFTSIVETAVIFALLVFFYREKRIDQKKILFSGIFASFATIPYVWFVFPYLAAWPHQYSLLVSELFAFLVEALFYRMVLDISWRKALTISLVANAASYFLGPMLRSMGIWIYW